MSEISMPIGYSGNKVVLADCFPKSVLLPVECEDQALINHSQTLQRLKERGGLSPCEAVALMQCRKWRQMNVVELVDAFREYHWL